MNNVIAVVGPTAVGKTSLSFSLAAYFETELISCDAYQIYKGMNIGTAKPTARQLAAYTHHLIDILDAERDFTSSPC